MFLKVVVKKKEVFQGAALAVRMVIHADICIDIHIFKEWMG